jgi:hypothetical protein
MIRRRTPRHTPLSTFRIRHLTNRQSRDFAFRLHCGRWFSTLVSSFDRNKRVVVPRHDGTYQNNNDSQDRENEPSDHHRIEPERVKLWKSERKYDCKNGAGDVAEKEGEEGWNFPVLSLAYDHVQVATYLITLLKLY